METSRESLKQSRRIVVKLGSRSLADNFDLIPRISAEVCKLSSDSRQFLLVSSGAVALGYRRLGYKERPKEMAKLQASAAVGQMLLMERYSQILTQHGRTAGQVLLTHADLKNRTRLNNARATLSALLDAGGVPIINENDTVATDEIRVGDNDQLAAMVVPLVSADLLLLLTDVDGVLDDKGERLPVLDSDAVVTVHKAVSNVGSGGIASKIGAARKAAHSGASVVIARAAADNVLERVLAGEDVGTYFPPAQGALRARQHWIAYTLRPKGSIFVDAGAEAALRTGKGSLLPVGVVAVSGQFNPGDAVRLMGAGGVEFARGLTRLGVLEVARAAGRSTKELASQFAHLGTQPVVVHRDDLVVQ